jgi:protein-S-isoprenylcysteine O-methyltransferase Ste14
MAHPRKAEGRTRRVFAVLGTAAFLIFYEEPTLRKSFPAEYAVYCADVPRWIPRLSPWRHATQ